MTDGARSNAADYQLTNLAHLKIVFCEPDVAGRNVHNVYCLNVGKWQRIFGHDTASRDAAYAARIVGLSKPQGCRLAPLLCRKARRTQLRTGLA